MKHFILKLSLFLIAAFNTSCHKAPTEPSPAIKTPRQMSWRCDTLTSPDATSIQLMMSNICAFSSKDIWITGWSDVARGLIWHYDGNRWTESNIFKDVGGMRVNDLAGYSGNDLWAGGYSGEKTFLAHFNGQKWERYPDMGIKGEIIDMCKDNSGNLWACARHGVVFKFSQGKWTADTVGVFHYPESAYFLSGIASYNGKICMTGIVADLTRKFEMNYFITGNMNNWTIADSALINSPQSQLRFGRFSLFSGGFNKLYSVGLGGIWRYDESGWNDFRKCQSTIYGMSGISENYLIAVGDYKNVLFYNGTGWENFSDMLPQADMLFVFTNTWTDGYDTFIIGYTGTENGIITLVWHGK